MGGRIYLVQSDSKLVTMNEQEYESESLLQELLAKHPELLAGEQMNAGEPRRWLLVGQEMSLATEEGGPGRWSVDHLFLDQDGVPTIVEVKRSTDTRIRREVVGQMLDYAANAVMYWPVESLRARFEANDPVQESSAVPEVWTDPDVYWERVKTNLRAGKIRMVFVADHVPPELQSIVEFLNGQLRTAEVLAVEVKQYLGQGVRSMVPRVIGQTTEAVQAKRTDTGRSRKADEESFFLELAAQKGPDAAANLEAITAIYEWCKINMPVSRWGWHNPSAQFNAYAGVEHQGNVHYVFSMWSGGGANLEMGYLKKYLPFRAEHKRAEFVRRLNQIPGFALQDRAINRYDHLPMAALRDEAGRGQFLHSLAWVAEGIRTETGT